ncbi:lincosamide and streptogramin A transport system ATP-binding/permease protein [Enterococcus sp. PF1-24]|uniref:ribosomal protection-like ABC-F family protein n=1 Tax=unclassified Enterococcus TaxID=2608891 RepID=UPI002476421F|nr:MULTISPECIES: ABC-F type ribosomal protection protein [unclassified Enterococcus]MDH6364961.1 lincosamide and streptogramin A transport system ATP-binding/permease protein [Enterococcus sp. PFB1-1]MDH6402062.1 lincosamide and streptogramin A transport system ATP-binding/permease protein [Enterococcus sp. PF1-24]
MSTIEIKDLTFAYDGKTPLFQEVNLAIDSHWKLGVIGRNGRGKTTLMKLLLGEIEYTGKISHKEVFSYFPQKITDDSQLTYYILQELADFEDWQLLREFHQLGLTEEIFWRPFNSLSGGEQTKVLLSLLFLEENAFPLIDEPTNHLDAASRTLVAKYLQKKKQGFILISHDRQFVDATVDHIISIEKRKLSVYQGNFSTYDQEKQREDAFEQQQNQKLKGEIQRLKVTAKEKTQWSNNREKDKYGKASVKGSGGVPDTGFVGARAARVMKKAKNLEKRMNQSIADKEELLKNIEYIDPLKMKYTPDYHQRILTVEAVGLAYGEEPLFAPVSFNLQKGQQIVIAGDNGAGKSALVQAILGTFKGEVAGTIDLTKNLAISYVKQNFESNQGNLKDFSEKNQLDYELFLSNLKKIGMERDVFNQNIETMSMGQKKKVEIAKSLSQEAALYIWDEPLNYLDVFNQKQIEEVLLAVQPTMILIEHDQQFIENIHADKIINLVK